MTEQEYVALEKRLAQAALHRTWRADLEGDDLSPELKARREKERERGVRRRHNQPAGGFEAAEAANCS